MKTSLVMVVPLYQFKVIVSGGVCAAGPHDPDDRPDSWAFSIPKGKSAEDTCALRKVGIDQCERCQACFGIGVDHGEAVKDGLRRKGDRFISISRRRRVRHPWENP